MRACLFYGPKELKIKDVKKPTIEDGEILIEVESAAVCGTDVRIYNGTKKIPTPRIIGHEFAGKISDVGESVYRFKAEDRVSVYPIIRCEECYACTSGRGNICLNRITIGYELDGGFAEFVRIPESAVKGNNIVKLPDNISFDEASITEPLAACIHGMERLKLGFGEYLWIVGAGPIGLMHLQLAKVFGAGSIIVSEFREDRLRIAKKMGADYVINPSKTDPIDEIHNLTNGKGVDKTVICVGSRSAIEDSIKAIRKGGRVVIFAGLPEGSKISLDPNLIHYKEIDIIGSSASTPYLHMRGVEMVSKRKIDLKSLITHRLSLENFEEALRIRERLDGLKIIIRLKQ